MTVTVDCNVMLEPRTLDLRILDTVSLAHPELSVFVFSVLDSRAGPFQAHPNEVQRRYNEERPYPCMATIVLVWYLGRCVNGSICVHTMLMACIGAR